MDESPRLPDARHARLLVERLDDETVVYDLDRDVLLLPAVESVVAPLAAQAASCTPLALCQSLPKTQCTGMPICEDLSQCCRRRGTSCVAKSC